VYRLTWRLPLAGLVAFSHLQFSQIRGRQPYLIVRKIPYLIAENRSKAPNQLRSSARCEATLPDPTLGRQRQSPSIT
jgi:hypothetical protein